MERKLEPGMRVYIKRPTPDEEDLHLANGRIFYDCWVTVVNLDYRSITIDGYGSNGFWDASCSTCWKYEYDMIDWEMTERGEREIIDPFFDFLRDIFQLKDFIKIININYQDKEVEVEFDGKRDILKGGTPRTKDYIELIMRYPQGVKLRTKETLRDIMENFSIIEIETPNGDNVNPNDIKTLPLDTAYALLRGSIIKTRWFNPNNNHKLVPGMDIHFRSDLEPRQSYGGVEWRGWDDLTWAIIDTVNEDSIFTILGHWGEYSPEMIDWDKTLESYTGEIK